MSYKNSMLQLGRNRFKRAGVRREVKNGFWKRVRQQEKRDPENADVRKRYRFWFD